MKNHVTILDPDVVATLRDRQTWRAAGIRRDSQPDGGQMGCGERSGTGLCAPGVYRPNVALGMTSVMVHEVMAIENVLRTKENL